jgi:hypothetical protein
MVKNQLIKIDGIDVTSKRISTRIEYIFRDRIDMAIIEFRFDINDLISLVEFQEVVIWENYGIGTLEQDSNRKLIGNISKIERNVGKIVVKVFSFLWRAIQTKVNKTYDINIDPEAGIGSDIFINLATLAEIDADSSSVVDTTPSGITIEKFVCNRAEIFERMITLSEIYLYQLFERYDTGKLYFQPLGFEENENIIYIGGENNNAKKFPKWTEDATKLFNKVTVLGATQETRITEEFDVTPQTEFILTHEPEIVEVEVDGVIQKGGVPGSSGTFDYTVDKKNKKIIFQYETDNAKIDYSFRDPRPVIRENEESIAEIGRTIESEPFTFSDIESVDDAEKRALNLLNVYSKVFNSVTIPLTPSTVENYNLQVGQSIRVIDTRHNKDLVLVITKIVEKFPQSDIDITLGDEVIRVASIEYDNSRRLKRLEEEMSRLSEIIRVVKSPKHTLLIDRRDLKVSKTAYDSGSGISIWGLGTDDGYFDWGSGKWGTDADAFLDEVLVKVTQGNNIYDEDFNDTNYKDTGNTTATWTGSGSVTFTSGQIAQSSSIDKDNETILTAKLTSTVASGSFNYELSADGGSHWETVTNGIKHFFINTGTDLKFRVTENSASTGEISNILIDDYH